jgi:hypothetical protein
MTRELRFIPSRVEGLTGVAEMVVFPDRIEMSRATGDVVTHRFADIARWPWPRILCRLLFRWKVGPKRLAVADRDWFHAPPDMYFEFYTRPRLKVFMPVDETKESYGGTCFVRIQNVIRSGGFETIDLG